MSARGLEAADVTVRRGRRRLLDAVGVTAEAGEVVGLIGPNGAGKTTLLRVLAGVLTPDAGRVTVAGNDVARTPARVLAREVALVEQQPRMDFAFAVRELVLMGRHAHLRRFQLERPEDLRVAGEALRTVGMHELADRDVTTLSGGERQLVAIARGLAQEPGVLLLDEPTSALDLGHQLRVLDLVAQVAVAGVAVAVAVHDLDLAARMCDRLVLLVGGRVAADGAPAEVLTPRLLLAAYGIHAVVRSSPDTGAPTVTAVRPGDPSALRTTVLEEALP